MAPVAASNGPGEARPSDPRRGGAALPRSELPPLSSSALGRGQALVVLNSGGGTVTGYGLAAAQLARLKNAGLRLTICVEQV